MGYVLVNYYRSPLFAGGSQEIGLTADFINNLIKTRDSVNGELPRVSLYPQLGAS